MLNNHINIIVTSPAPPFKPQTSVTAKIIFPVSTVVYFYYAIK